MDITAVPHLLTLRGRLVVVGKQPDGDSIRFVPDRPELLAQLKRHWRIKPSAVDGSVQLRLEAIDAPETHYGALAQPLGDAARDELLALLGFTHVVLDDDGKTVTSADPSTGVPAAILSEGADVNGRPISFLAFGDDLPPDGERVPVTDELLAATANARLLESGAAYSTIYSSLSPILAQALRVIARAARDAGRGVWARDSTAAFHLEDGSLEAPDGTLVLPKVFRRCTDYLKSAAPHQTLDDWMRQHDEDDELIVDGSPTRLSAVLRQSNREVSFLVADMIDLIVIER